MKYAIYNGSITAHCCFRATVVDTSKPITYDGKHFRDRDGQLKYESVCECIDEKFAVIIRDALNSQEGIESP